MKKIFRVLFPSLVLAQTIAIIPIVSSCKSDNPYIDFKNLKSDYTDGNTVTETKQEEGLPPVIEHNTYWTIDNLIWKKKNANIEDLKVEFISKEDEDILNLSLFKIKLNDDFETSHKFSLIFKSLADWQPCCYHLCLSFFSSSSEDVPFYESPTIRLAAAPLLILENKYVSTRQWDELSFLLQPCNFDYFDVDINNELGWKIYIGEEDVITSITVNDVEKDGYRYISLTFPTRSYSTNVLYHAYFSFTFTNADSEYTIWNDFYFVKTDY